MTSGEATWRALAERSEPFFRELGSRCILWSRSGDRSLVEELGLQLVERAEDADFLLLGGIEDTARLEDSRDALERAAARDLPMVCGNPGIVAVQANGIFGGAPGAGFALIGGLEANQWALARLGAEFGVRPRWLLPRWLLPRFRWQP